MNVNVSKELGSWMHTPYIIRGLVHTISYVVYLACAIMVVMVKVKVKVRVLSVTGKAHSSE